MPITQAQIDAFAKKHDQAKDPARREELQRWFVNYVEQSSENTTYALSVLQQAGRQSGVTDLNKHLSFFQTPSTPPIDPTTAQQALTEAQEDVPWWRRAAAKTLEGLDWWQKNAVEPSAAQALNAIFQVTPGEQNFERRLTEARQNLAREQGVEENALSFKEGLNATTEAYRKTNLPTGAKGFLELVFDPLNLLGTGVPAKLAGRSAPLVKNLLFPLRVIDEAPGAVTSKLLEVPGGLKFRGNKIAPGVQDVPGLRGLAKPHFSTQVREAYQRTYTAIGEAFGGPTMADGTPEDTARVLSNLTNYPQDTGAYSLRNIMNHLADVHGERAWAGKDGTGGIIGKINNMAPQDAANSLAQLVAAQESRAIRLGSISLDTGKPLAGGGRRITGEVVKEGSRSRRIQKFESIFDKLNNDAKWSRGLAEGADNWLHRFETLYLRKIEPNVIRPYALAHLAFAGFAPMNMLEDIGMSMIGLGSSPFGVSDEMWTVMTSDLDAPAHLINAGGQATNTLDLALGKFNQTGPNMAEKVATVLGGWFVKKSSEYGWAYRRSSWLNTYNKEFPKALQNAGLEKSEIEALKTLVTTEVPEGLEHLGQDIGTMAWQAATTGDPDKIRNLRQLATSARMVQKAQASLIPETANLPPAARDVMRKVIFREGGITADNADDVMRRMTEELVEWHRLATPEGIRASYKDFIGAIGQKPATTSTGAMAQLSLLQTASDTLADMANEMRRNAFHRAKELPPQQRARIFDETDDLTDEMVQEVRATFEEAVERVRPIADELLSSPEITRTVAQTEAVSRSVNEIFDGYKSISENLRKTWSDHINTRRQLRSETPVGERDDAFYLILEDKGDEIWEAERQFRAREANRIREGWNALTDVVKLTDLSPKNREIFKAGLGAQLGNAHKHYSELADEVKKLEETLPQLSDQQQAVRQARINDARRDLRIAAEHELQLQKELENFGRVRNTAVPEELRKYDTAIRTLRRQEKLAETHGFDHHIEGIREQIGDLTRERAERFEEFIPDFAKQRWQTLKNKTQALQSAIAEAPTDAQRAALTRERTRTIRDMARFRKQIEKGSLADFAEQFKGITRQTVSQAADEVLTANNGVLPDTVDEMVGMLNSAAERGDTASVELVTAINENMVRADEIYESLYTRAAQKLDTARLNRVDIHKLSEIATNPDAVPSSLTTKLVEEGFVTQGARLRNGRVRFELTDTGREALGMRAINQTPARELPPLPNALRRAAPRFNQQKPAFATDVDKALYIIANPRTKSASHDRYMEFLKEATGVTDEAELINIGQDVRTAVRDAAQGGADEFNVPQVFEGGATPRQEPLPAARAVGQIEIDDLMDMLPEPERVFRSTLDGLLTETEDVVRKAVDVANNPPMRPADEARVGGFFDKIADHLEARPDMRSKIQQAKKEAAAVTNEKYNQFFVNYDNRTTFDFIMQRMMPFWMYESRRWPRLIRLAGKRPILAKYMANTGLDWDYGYTPTPFGYEFNPVKGTLVGGLRRTGSRDFPELHNDLRGNVEQGLDWLGRGGFYFAPPFTAAFDISQGEVSNTLPPPVSLILHGIAGGIGKSGGEIPAWLQGITFSSRYTNFLTDQVIADTFSENPNAIRRGVENGDEEAIAKMNLARGEAAFRMITLQQASVLRFRPQSKRDFAGSSEEAIAEYTGISVEQQEEFKRLGIPLYSIIPVSGFQKKAIREAIPDYDAWISANISLRPVEEQRQLRAIDKFWSRVEQFQTDFESDMELLNQNWLDGKMSGADVRSRYSEFQSQRAAKFQSLKSDPEFTEVPITMEERQAWAEKYGSVPPMVHPVDEVLEQYYAITPEDYVDEFTGEPDFGAFFQAREEKLAEYADTPFIDTVKQSLRMGDTDVERSLKNAGPWLRQYYGIRDELLEELNQTNPQAVSDYNIYRQLRVLANNSVSDSERNNLNRQAREILRRSPELPMLERKVRAWRRDYRENNPEMELVYQMWISRPSTTPSSRKVIISGGGTPSMSLGTLKTLESLRLRNSLTGGR